jgi:beta-aspartyl-peptidase (threonine type)
LNPLRGWRQIVTSLLTLVVLTAPASSQPVPRKWAVVLHGGAGVIERKAMPPKLEAEYRASLTAALQAAADVLNRGGAALDAVERAITLLEDDPLFNAGRGAVFTAGGNNELDASIMDGATLNAGAVAGVTRTRHPVSLARAVMEKSPHVMLIGPAADGFAAEQGLEQVDPSFFFTERRWEELLRSLRGRGLPLPPRPAGVPAAKPVAGLPPPPGPEFGTVGIVVVDRRGSLAAGTSTGGTQAKRPGRVGDTPVIGAGTYAANASCAVSGTGTGEYFIRLTVAREVCALVEYRGLGIQAAADEVIHKRLTALNGSGGVIAVRANGDLAWSFNTQGMYRARMTEGGRPAVSIFKDEP